MKLRGAVVVVLLATSVVVAVAPAHAASTRAEYAQQADPICKSSDKRTGRLWRRFRRLASQYPFKIQAAANALEGIGREISSVNNSLRLIAHSSGR